MQDFIKIEDGLKSLCSVDEYLLENNVSERAITHKLAEHYQKLFLGWNVDCEYDKNLGGPKKVEIKPQEILLQMANFLEGSTKDERFHSYLSQEDIGKEDIRDLERQLRDPKNIKYIRELDLYIFLLKVGNRKIIRKKIYPDIIVHSRGKKENHIVFEVKKTTNDNKKARTYDILKLITMVSSPDFEYGKGIFIDLPVKEKFESFKALNESFRRESVGNLRVFEYLPNL